MKRRRLTRAEMTKAIDQIQRTAPLAEFAFNIVNGVPFGESLHKMAASVRQTQRVQGIHALVAFHARLSRRA